jgi:hypothetical protein
LCRRRLRDLVAVHGETVAVAAQLAGGAGTGGTAVGLGGAQEGAVQRVAAVAFASVLCSEVVVLGAVGGTLLEGQGG